MSAVPNLPGNVLDKTFTDTDAQDPTHKSLNVPTNGVHVNGTSPAPVSSSANDAPTSSSLFQHLNRPVDFARPLRVIVIGAGFSGIYLGIRIPQRLRNIELVIYDKNPEVGGTWYENTYPGVACDVPSHSYQYSFSPNTQWSSLYAPGAEIQRHLASKASQYSATRFIKLSHKVEECRWDEKAGKWHLRVRKLDTGKVIEDTCDVLVNAGGRLSEPKWPDIEGFHDFKGEVMHSARWNNSYDFTNKTIAVIGSGSSSIQIIPQLQRLTSTTLDLYIRNRTWISPPFGASLHDSLGLSHNSVAIPDSLREKFAADPAAYAGFRLKIEEAGNNIHAFTMRGSEANNGAKTAFEESMRQRLAKRPDIFEKMLPEFSPGCRRLTPGEGYLEALSSSNVNFIDTPITGVEANGIRTSDGKLHPADALVCATGFYASVAPPYAVIGRDGKTLEQHWRDYPRTYLSHSTDSFPNLFTMLGPNAAIGSGSLTMMLESVGDYILKCIRKIQKENIKTMSVKSARVEDFKEFCGGYFEGTVFSEECRSWYKSAGGEVTGLWPGSTQHCIEVMRSPRWEDYEYDYLGDERTERDSLNGTAKSKATTNALSFLGNGWTENQLAGKHLAWYLYPQFVDTPPSPRPEEGEDYEIRPFSN